LLSALRLCGALVVNDEKEGGEYLDCHWNSATRDSYDGQNLPSTWPCRYPRGVLSQHGAAKTVLCIGDSITAGSGVHKKTEAYPAVLHRLLNRGGDSYNVVSLGVPGVFVQKKDWSDSRSHFSYWNLPHWKVAMDAAFDIAIIQLGTNDAGYAVWNEETFRADYTEMIRQLRKAQPQAKFIAGIPPPSGENGIGINPDTTRGALPVAIRRLMQDLGVEVVDNAQRFAEHAAEGLMSGDNVHPTAAGHDVMARGFLSAIGKLLSPA